MDDCIIVGDTISRNNKLIQSLHKGDENFILQDNPIGALPGRDYALTRMVIQII